MIKRLRRANLQAYHDVETAWSFVFAYLIMGGILSSFYFAGALFKSDFLHFIASAAAFQNLSFTLVVIQHVIGSSMVRILTWAPDYVSSVLLGPVSTHDWLWGVRAVTLHAAG